MRFTYKCSNGHGSLHEFQIGRAPETLSACGEPTCSGMPRRDFSADWSSTQHQGDPWRQYHLGVEKMKAAGSQGRAIGGPTDSTEKRILEATTGRQYVENDTSGFTKAAQRGIDRYKDRGR